MKTAKTSNFFHDKPLFGLDIGYGSLKVMQVASLATKLGPGSHPRIIGYGTTQFDTSAFEDGIIVQPEIIAKAAHDLFTKHLIGDITTSRVAMAIPAYRTFTRSLHLPALEAKDLRAAVELEAEQYISLPLEELYLDYDVVTRTKDATELLLVAVPRVSVDSCLNLAQILGLEPVLVEPTLSSVGRLFSLDGQSDVPTIVIDFGSLSSNISIFDKNTLVSGTVQGGGHNFTESISSVLGVTKEEAALIKTRYGLSASKRQAEIKQAIEPILEQIVKEIHRMMRYYEERYGQERPISQIVTLGGGANMPGLSEYLTQSLRLAVRHTDFWQYFKHKGLQPPAAADKPMYATVAGLSITDPKAALL